MNKKIIALIGAIIVILCIAIPFAISKNAKYEVKFNSDGGTIVETQKVKKGEVASKPADPTKEGYVFDNWYLNDVVYDFSSEVTKNITLEAKWTKVDTDATDNTSGYTVTFNTNGGSKISSEKVSDGEKVKKPTDPTKNGYKFVEWLLNGKAYDFSKEVTGNITLVASWEKDTTTTTNTTDTSKKTTKTTTSKNTTTKSNVNTTNTQTQTQTNTQTQSVRVSSVSVSKSSLSLKVGESANLSVSINPSNATNKNATWTSSNSSVATVDGNGKVTAVGSGSATITVTVDGKSASASVTVNKNVTYSIEEVRVDDSSANQYTYYIKSSEGNHVSGIIEITLNSGNTKQYNVTSAGLVFSKSVISNVKVISVN